MSDYSLGDIVAATGKDGFGGGNSAWVLIILFALIFGWGGNGFGTNRGAADYATSADVQRSTDFAALERQNNEGVAATRTAAYDVMGAIKDASYNNLSEIRDLNTAVNAGFANAQNCCCEIKSGILENRYLSAQNTGAIQLAMANDKAELSNAIHAEGEATRALIQQNKIEALQQKVSALEMQNAMCGVVRYPNASTYYAGTNPFCGNGCGCNGNAF